MITDRVCAICDKIFKGGPRAKYCPTCRVDAQKDASRRYKINGANRPLGSKDICSICGNEYVVNGSNQMYCLACRDNQYKMANKLQSLEWYNRNNSDINVRRKDKRIGIKKCVWCGKEFISHTKRNTCSEYCWRKNKNAKWLENHNKNITK